MYFRRHKRKETNVVKGHFATKSFQPLDVSAPRHFGPRLFLCTSHSKTGQGIKMAETLIIILAEHNVPINFADHFTKLVSNKLVFPDSVFLRACSARTLLAKSSHRAHCHYFFFQKLNMSAYFMARSNLVPCAFVWEKGKTMDFSETVVVYDLKLATDDQSDKKFLLTSKLCPLGGCMPLVPGLYICIKS